MFAKEDKLWLSKVDNLKSFKDVVDLAKETFKLAEKTS